MPGQELIHTHARADLSTRRKRRTGEQVASLRAVNIPLLRFSVVEAADEQQFLTVVGDRV